MTDPHRDAAIAYVDLLLQETGLDLTNLAHRAGVSSTTLTRFRNHPDYRNSLSGRTLKKLSDTTGVPLPADLGGAAAGTAPQIVPRPQGDIPRNLPILGASRSPRTLYSFAENQAASYVERPWFLFGQPEAYAVYVNDSSMEPVLRPGHLVYVSPMMAPAPGDDVVVQLTDGSGLIKRLHDRNAKRIVVRQFRPAKQSKIELEQLRALHLVVAVLRTRS